MLLIWIKNKQTAKQVTVPGKSWASTFQCVRQSSISTCINSHIHALLMWVSNHQHVGQVDALIYVKNNQFPQPKNAKVSSAEEAVFWWISVTSQFWYTRVKTWLWCTHGNKHFSCTWYNLVYAHVSRLSFGVHTFNIQVWQTCSGSVVVSMCYDPVLIQWLMILVVRKHHISI